MKLTRIFDFLPHQLEKYNLSDALNIKIDGDWYCYSSKDFYEIAHRMSIGLLKSGIKKGDKVAIISGNRPEWNFIDFGVQHIGAVTVPIYPTITEEDFRYIFEHSESKVVFVDSQEIYEKAKRAAVGTGIEEIYTFDKISGAKHWSEVETLADGEDFTQLDSHKDSVKGEDMISIIYTSGTTGRPKGVMLTHNNLLFNTVKSAKVLPKEIKWGKYKALSFLPICHIAERSVINVDIYTGASIYYAESIEKVADNLKEVKPDYFFTVPRLLEKVYDKIMAKGADLDGIKKGLFDWAVETGLKYEPNESQGFIYDLKLAAANNLIFSKWREALGGNLKFILVGAAPLQPKLTRIFWAAGIRIGEGYGLTETSPSVVLSIVSKKGIRIGCAGAIMEGVTVKIAEDGEILVKGPNVMLGYYKDEAKTNETIIDGWFHTGDIGEILEGKYLKITDRKKEMFKTSGGKYVAPGYLENTFKQSIFIEQMAVVGANHKFPAALIVPNFEALEDWCKDEGIAFTLPEEMVVNPKVIAKYQSEMDKYNVQFGKWEQIKKISLIPTSWDVSTGELTPTMKLKRRVIDEKYKANIDGIYKGLE
jgi:long-chain acyl-CoA synthetase